LFSGVVGEAQGTGAVLGGVGFVAYKSRTSAIRRSGGTISVPPSITVHHGLLVVR
jgi:hypothetical protein